jgi:farnesol kinase
MNPFSAWAVTTGVALFSAEAVGALAVSGRVPHKFARKFLHVTMGVVFVLCWPLFPGDVETRFTCAALAASIPFGMAIKFALVAFNVITDEKLLVTASRSGTTPENSACLAVAINILC